MPGKTPNSNGNKPTQNGYRSTKDVDMKDAKSKNKKGAKDGDEEMTVVVPPSKGTKQPSTLPPPDADGDVAMGDEENADDAAAVKVDPVVQAVAGMWRRCSLRARCM
ncbi:hypothetical protein HYQ45_017119 [Verticillium longisporum]|uniref:Uncharacterized protein n=1 Tax=Verticillium longisporum TaxID=100787 RepID=A0A8I3AHI1_VERLO|nr:hypothetical protein HYQ45_017119 [Verticillium longisporum]